MIWEEIRKRRRHLPHWEGDHCVYFITFRSIRGALPEIALAQAMENIRFDDGRRYDLHLAVVMPDHVHLLIQPLGNADGGCYSLSEILKGLKGASARRINQLLNTSGAVWQEESFDRIVRDQKELEEKMGYMWNNPAKAGL